MKIRKTTIATAVFVVLVLAAYLLMTRSASTKAMKDVKEYEKTGKTKYNGNH